MKRLLESRLYREDVAAVAGLDFDWNTLSGRNVLISGASGMVGSFLIDVLMHKNKKDGLNCGIYALGRNAEKAENRFLEYWQKPEFHFIAGDINRGISAGEQDAITGNEMPETVDFILHAASNTHPRQYATDPVGTVTTNIIGTNNLLSFGKDHGCRRFTFLSSVEIYGENRGDTDRFAEDYLGYIDCNTMRAGYPESKRCGEALCQAYIAQYGMDIVIPRLSRIYGPTMQLTDSKAISQFIKKGAAGEDIILKSEGTQLYSYSYVADAVAGILTVFFRGECGACYNVSDRNSDITLRDLAKIIADYAGRQVVFDLPDETERAGYSKATKATLDPAKLEGLGFRAATGIRAGLEKTMEILREVYDMPERAGEKR